MPIWLRRFTFQQIQEFYSEQNKQGEKEQEQIQRVQSKIKTPNYNVKSPKK
jgi:hypothetical protein